MAAIAAELGVRRSTISALLRRAGVAIRQPRQISDSDVDQAVTLYAEGWSLTRVAEQLAFDAETIRQHLKLRGVVPRGPHDRP